MVGHHLLYQTVAVAVYKTGRLDTSECGRASERKLPFVVLLARHTMQDVPLI